MAWVIGWLLGTVVACVVVWTTAPPLLVCLLVGFSFSYAGGVIADALFGERY